MAAANPWWKRTLAWLWASLKSKRTWAKLGASLKSQWLASTLLIPLAFLVYSTYNANQVAREARVQAINVDRLTKVQDSGKALDLALASYFQSIAELGLAERHLHMPDTYQNAPVAQAQAAVVQRRNDARKALADHASDVQRLRGAVDEDASKRYMAALADISTTIDGGADIDRTGQNITNLSKLVVARNALVDSGMRKVG